MFIKTTLDLRNLDQMQKIGAFKKEHDMPMKILYKEVSGDTSIIIYNHSELYFFYCGFMADNS